MLCRKLHRLHRGFPGVPLLSIKLHGIGDYIVRFRCIASIARLAAAYRPHFDIKMRHKACKTEGQLMESSAVLEYSRLHAACISNPGEWSLSILADRQPS